MQFQAKILQFYVKITPKCVNFLKCVQKFYTEVEKMGSRVWTEEKSGVIGCKIGIKKGVYWQALDIHWHMGVPPPPPPPAYRSDVQA